MEIFIIGVLFALSIFLMALEIFLIPGTSIAGILSGCCLVAAHVVVFHSYGFLIGLTVLAASLIACGLIGWRMLHSKTLDRLSLKSQITGTSAPESQKSVRPGDTGKTITRLALTGNALIQDKVVEVQSADGFLDEGTDIQVVRVEDTHIWVVRKQS